MVTSRTGFGGYWDLLSDAEKENLVKEYRQVIHRQNVIIKTLRMVKDNPEEIDGDR